jgi:UDP-2-acetamido-3-amino-2,3-dideoxy-glucuronate N-acetyltransferase
MPTLIKRCRHIEREGDIYMIHESSYVETDQIGEGTKIWHFCHVESTAKIGKNCVIGQGCYIGHDVVIGDNCRIQNGVSLFTGVTLGKYVFIGPHAVFTNVHWPRSGLKQKPQKTIIEDYATIGAGANIRCGVIIGHSATVGMGAIILKDVPQRSVIVDKGRRI